MHACIHQHARVPVSHLSSDRSEATAAIPPGRPADEAAARPVQSRQSHAFPFLCSTGYEGLGELGRLRAAGFRGGREGKMLENRAGGLIVRQRSEESWSDRVREQTFSLRERSLFPTSPLSRQTDGFRLVALPQSKFSGPQSGRILAGSLPVPGRIL